MTIRQWLPNGGLAVVAVLWLIGCAPSGGSPATPDWSGAWVLAEDSIAAAAQDSLGLDSGRVPLNAKYLAARAQSVKLDTPGRLPRCLAAGMPGALDHPMMHEYLFTPGRVTMLFEDGEVRRIYTDGRTHPPLDEQRDSSMGHSVGRWDGSVLVVETVGMPKADLLMNFGLQTTPQTRVDERIFRRDVKTMQIDSVVTDPEIFTVPYRYTRLYEMSPLPMVEPRCSQTNRDTGTSIELSPPPDQSPRGAP